MDEGMDLLMDGQIHVRNGGKKTQGQIVSVIYPE